MVKMQAADPADRHIVNGMLLVSTSAYASETDYCNRDENIACVGCRYMHEFCVAFTIYKGSVAIYKYMNAQPEEKPKYKKEATEILIAAVVIATLGSTITFILAKYGA